MTAVDLLSIFDLHKQVKERRNCTFYRILDAYCLFILENKVPSEHFISNTNFIRVKINPHLCINIQV